MPLRSRVLTALLVSLALGTVSLAEAQTKAPVRTAQAQAPRGPAQQAAQPTDPQVRQQVPPRGQVGAQPNVGGPVRAPQVGAPNQPAGGQGVVKPLQPPQAKVPFVLTPAQEQLLSQILLKWEKESSKVSYFTCTFARWEIDKTWGPKHLDFVKSEAKGTIKYKAPDHGTYQVEKLDEWNQEKNAMVNKPEALDHWVCDGKKIFEYNHVAKQLIERDLPAEMQGKAITDGPLPFIFGAKADQLMKRYWMRDVTPREYVGKEVWLEAWPKRQQDSANFHHATLILSDPAFKPTALQIYLPDGTNHTDYAFDKTSVNSPLALVDFLPPRTPFGWKRVVNPEAEKNEAPAAPPAAQGQAKRLIQRK